MLSESEASTLKHLSDTPWPLKSEHLLESNPTEDNLKQVVLSWWGPVPSAGLPVVAE